MLHASVVFEILQWTYLHLYVRGVMQSVALIDIYYVNTMQMLVMMLKVILYQYAFALDE